MRYKVYPVSQKLYTQLREEESGGICLSCGHIHHSGCEPDARNYPCEECGEMEVFGIEEALLMGRITCDTPEDETEAP